MSLVLGCHHSTAQHGHIGILDESIKLIKRASKDMIFTLRLHENPLIEDKCLLGLTPCSLSGIKVKSFRRSLLPPSSGLPDYKVPRARRQFLGPVLSIWKLASITWFKIYLKGQLLC